MDFTRRFEDDAQALIDTVLRRLEAALQPFADALDSFLAVLFSGRLPVDWRERWHQFVAEQAAEGFLVEPKSVRELEDWIEAWARYCELLPLEETAPAERIRQEAPVPVGAASANPAAPIDVRDASSARDAPVHLDTTTVQPAEENIVRDPRKRRPTTDNPHELFFYGKLYEALNQLDEMRRVLTELGTKLDEAVDVEAEADQIEELIWQYNNAVESALDSWLRDDLSREASTHLNEMHTPASLGLPRFTDDEQAARALRQASQVAKRSRERDAVMDRLVTGLEITETVTTWTAIVLGVGLLAKTAWIGGRWVFVKTVAVGAAAYIADTAAEKILRAAGASEQTIRGVRLAAMVVTFILLRRRSRMVAESPKEVVKSTVAESEAAPADPKWDLTHPLIEGSVDKPRSLNHMRLQQAIAEEMQASGDYTRVAMNKPLSEFSELKHSPNIRCDNMGLRVDGRIDLFEIRSRSQTKEKLLEKLEAAMQELPAEMRGDCHVFDPPEMHK